MKERGTEAEEAQAPGERRKFLVVGAKEALAPGERRKHKFIACLCSSGKHRSVMIANLLKLLIIACEGWCDVEFANWAQLTAKFWTRARRFRKSQKWKCPKCHELTWFEDKETWGHVQHWVAGHKRIWSERTIDY